MREGEQPINSERFQKEGDEHRVLAADMVEIQPKNGRVSPFMARSSASANVSAGSVNPRIATGILSILKSFAIGPSCACAIRPPTPTSTNMAYMAQNGGDLITSGNAQSRRPCCTAATTGTDTSPGSGARSSCATKKTTRP